MTRTNTDKLIYPEISEAVIGSAMKALNTLKPGLDEKAYENALVLELRKQRHLVDQQRRFEVRYDGALVDILVPEMIVDDLVIVDPKVVETFTETHFAQMQGYLTITQLRLAMLLNFKFADLRWKRIIR
ncbi:MAG TPA: GxxExxY protein [Lacunisphaera sp.]|nr:GxxExxY protein [Lacunisphaera sp.]